LKHIDLKVYRRHIKVCLWLINVVMRAVVQRVTSASVSGSCLFVFYGSHLRAPHSTHHAVTVVQQRCSDCVCVGCLTLLL